MVPQLLRCLRPFKPKGEPPMSMNVKDVQYSHYDGGGNIETGIAEACRKAGLSHNDYWV